MKIPRTARWAVGRYSVILCANAALYNVAKFIAYSPMYLNSVSATSTKFEKKRLLDNSIFKRSGLSWLFDFEHIFKPQKLDT